MSPSPSPLFVALGLSWLAACAPPDTGDMFQTVEVELANDPLEAHEPFISLMDGATETLFVDLPRIEDLALSDALIAAWERGVEVEVVTDVDHSEDAGVIALQAVGVPLTLADGFVTYFEFSLGSMVEWESDDTIMSHATAVADGKRYVGASDAGYDEETGLQVVLSGKGEDICTDLEAEHRQIFGGIDATSLTAYSSLAKSVTDSRWRYATEDEVDLEVWFGPQERLVKRVIDATWGAKASIWIMTPDATDEAMVEALQAKAADGFDVRLIVGPDFGAEHEALGSAWLEDTPDVLKYQVDDAVLPTMVLIDVLEGRDGNYHRPRGMVLTHPLYSAGRLYNQREIRTDQLIDGTLWQLDTYDEPTGDLQLLIEQFQLSLDLAQEL